MTKLRAIMFMTGSLRRIENTKFLERSVFWGKNRYSKTIGDFKVEYSNDAQGKFIIISSPDGKHVSVITDNESKKAMFNDATCCMTTDIMKLAIELIKQECMNTIELVDTMAGPDWGGGLAHFFKYGETWYEKYFGFNPSTDFVEKYEKLKQHRLQLLDISFLEAQPLEYFTYDVMASLMRKIDVWMFFDSMSWVKQL